MSSRSAARSADDAGLSKTVRFWLIISGCICIVDALFVLLRPHTLPAGADSAKQPAGWLAVFPFSGWHLYMKFDTRYGWEGIGEPFVILQSLLNLVEVAVQFTIVYLASSGCNKKVVHAITAAISIVTFYKTVIYLLLESVGDEKYKFVHPSKVGYSGVAFVVALSSPWALFPLYAAYSSLTALVYGGGGCSAEAAAAVVATAKKSRSARK